MMTVEMNAASPLNTQCDLVKRRNMRLPSELDDIDRRLSTDDVHSLNSWSENLSTSSSSDSLSLHGSSSSYRHGGQIRDVRSKANSTSNKGLSVGRTQKNFDRPGLSAPRSYESSILPSSTTNIKYGFEEFLPEINTLGSFDAVDGTCNQIREPGRINIGVSDVDRVVMNESEHINTFNAVSPSTNRNPEILDPNKLKVKSIYPNLDEMKCLYADENYFAVSNSSSSPNNSDVNNKPTQTKPQTQRRSFFDFNKLPNNRPRTSHTQSGETYSEEPHRTFSFLSASNNQRSDLTRNFFDKYKNKDEHVSNQNTSLLSRLHKSQPSIASEPHLRRQPKSSNDLESLRLSYEQQNEGDNVKTKVKSVWNNIKYGWAFKSKSSIKCDSALYILGKCYLRQKDDPNTDVEDQFLRDFASRIWFTYRSNFYPIAGTKLTTDCGWGCMLRSGQMLVAQCLVTHFLGRGWRLYDQQTNAESAYYREILRWFSDPVESISDKTPFCLHHLVNFGRLYNKDPGEWYGPASVAYIFRDAFTKAALTIPILNKLCIYVAQDCTVYIEDVIKMCSAPQRSENMTGCEDGASTEISGKWQRSLIILIPIRLGGEVMNEIYIPCVQSLLSQDNCMGIIGGKPKHSLYFIGWQDDKLIYLDPHLCRDAVDTSIPNFRIETYHCMTPRKLSINKMDPSCTVGFYIHDAEDFKKFIQNVREFVSPPKQKGTYPLFIFSDGHLNESPTKHNQPEDGRRVRVTHYSVNQNGQRLRSFSDKSEDFVML